MPRYKVALGILAVGGQERCEVGSFRETAAVHCAGRADMDLITIPIARTPTPIARNVLVKVAREHGCDFLVMLDEDMGVPPAFFKEALAFLVKHPGPAAIGVPYCTSSPREDVLVFEHAAAESGAPGAAWAITNVVREDAARRTGIEECANIGTGCIAYSMSFFNALTLPYFDYSYNEDHTQVIETEDCYCHRRAWQKGLDLFVHWDFWGNHYKLKRVSKPIPIGRDDVVKAFARDAQAVDRLAARGQRQAVNGTLSVRGNGCKVE
jgi:hypothetical protein